MSAIARGRINVWHIHIHVSNIVEFPSVARLPKIARIAQESLIMEVCQCIRARNQRSGRFVHLMKFLILLLVLHEARGQSPCYYDQARTLPQRCMPSFGNAAFNKKVLSNNTCGTPPSEFCVQTGVTSPTKECEICDATDPRYRHPAFYITDIKDDQNRTWWQSETMLDNPDKPVTITLDLGKTYDVSYIRIRFRSPRPESMAIYKRTSTDPNAPWIPYQYMSAACEKTYKVPTQGIVTRENQQVALCTDEFSGISPLTGGNVAFTTLIGRPDNLNFDNSLQLQEWVTASAIRIDLDRMNTFGDEVFGDPNVLRSYYFAIIDLTVGGRCKCNGHAARCETKQQPGGLIQLRCECEHNTAGVDCEECLPLYNDRPWARAVEDSANECRKCDCNGLADSCVYDEFLGRGRCLNCKRNTAGPNCERCKDFFFRFTRRDICQPCNCDPIGSFSLQCDSTGQCRCKPGVTGIKCDRCQPNYFGFTQTGCRPCQCSPEGTNPSNTQCNEKGECSCKRNVIGVKCTQCRTGFYGLEELNPHGCRQCFCYGHSTVCKAALGYTGRNITSEFRSGLEGWMVNNEQGADVTEQYAVHHRGDSHISVTAVGNEVLYMSAPRIFLGNRRSSYGQLFGFSFRVASTEGVQVERGDVILEGEDGVKVRARLNAQNNPVPSTEFQQYVFRLHEDPSLGWEPLIKGFDFQRLLTNIKSIRIRMNYASQGTGLIDNVFLESAVYDPTSPLRVRWVEECSCPAPYTGDHCERCSDGYTREKGSVERYGQCVPCQCYGHSDTCDPVSGTCYCKHNTVGENCDDCQDGFYGNPTEGTEDDCKPCPCKFGSRCILIGKNIVCTNCPEGHSGNLCDQCQDGYYGDPAGLLGFPTGCQKCNCSGNIDANAIGNCNSLTGECLKCIYNTRNGPFQRCERCAVGFYGNAPDYPKPQCVACDCYTQGTVAPPGHNPVDPLPCDDRGRCTCMRNVIGDKCDSCQDTYWNVGSGFGCEQCKCNPMGSLNNSCDVNTGQCPCKPGVTGRMCDQCQPDHYAFSKQGCVPCNCSPQGSLNESCNEYGVCNCKPGVLGIKCDSCKENYHNLTAACITCPPCYNDIQRLVNDIRRKVRQLVYIVDRFNSSAQIIIDADFEGRLKKLTEEINKLLEKAEESNTTDKILQQQLVILNKRVDGINMAITDVWSSTNVTESVVGDGVRNISEAEASINRSRALLDEAEMRLMKEGSKALNESFLAANSSSEQATRMLEIKNETGVLADKHEVEGEVLSEKAKETLNKSKEAVEATEQAVDSQQRTTDGIDELLKKLNRTIELSEETSRDAERSRDDSQDALDEADELYANGTAPLPDLGLPAMKAKINTSKEEVANANDRAEEMVALLESLVISFDTKEEDVRKKMDEWPGLLDRLERLLMNVAEANETAHDAIGRGEETLRKAKEMLERLKKFNDIIDTSRKEAEQAEANIPEIERLIKSANDKSDEATDKLGDAQNLATEAEATAQEAQDTANRTQQKAAIIKQEAEELSIPEDNVTEPVTDGDRILDDFKIVAEQQEQEIAGALKKAKSAGTAATKARDKIADVLAKLKAILSEIDNVGTVNNSRLELLERQLINETDTVRQLDREVQGVEEKSEMIRDRITQYTIDLDKLRAEKQTLQKIYEQLPKVCPKVTPPTED